jgi:hypothetical protein|tara:strand:- start:78 stop:242 length:165 start_codon:yes stop_codon:yes gene_type:complete
MGENEVYISVLKAEIEHLKTRIEPHDTGHIHTTISTLEHRVKELLRGHRKVKVK